MLADEPFTVAGRVAAPLPGDRVDVTFRRGRNVLGSAQAPVGSDGAYGVGFRVGTGPVTITARLARDGSASSTHVLALKPFAGNWERGTHVLFLQERLRRLRYAAPLSGRMDVATQRAVLAFRKVNEMQRVTNASRAVFVDAASGRGAYSVRFPGHGRHVEGDLTHQVVALVNAGGRVQRVYVTSSGRPGLRTPSGSFRVYRHHWGWRGGMLDGSYFAHPRGYPSTCGVHGYPWVPTYPASHCCLRVPIPNAWSIYSWINLGDRIFIYR